VNGKQVHSLGGLHTLIASHRPGDTLSVTYRRSGRTATAKIRTIAGTDDKRQAAIGILVDETGGSVGKLPIKVRPDGGARPQRRQRLQGRSHR
jgi:PDZ domain-containing secreted protein